MNRTPDTSLGILGDDPLTAEIAAAARARGWEVFRAVDVPGAGAPGTQSWTSLLDAMSCAAVVVGAGDWNPARAEAVRTLVQAGRTLVLAQPLELSMVWAFELDMIARDSGARLVPALPDRLHPSVAALKAAVEAAMSAPGQRGPLESIRLERTMPDRRRETVLAALSRDVDIVRVLAGDPARLATLGGATDSAWATLAVGLTGPSQVPARWQVAPGGVPGLRIVLEHAHGSLEVFAPDGPGAWTASPPLPPPAPFDRGDAVIDHLAGILGRRVDGFHGPVPPASWTDAARALEIAETVPRSLAKGRAIDLHGEEFSEIGTFKGTMASLGCGIVLAALCLVVLATLVAGVARELDWEAGQAVANAWPAIVLGALMAFLALQLLPLLVGPDQRSPESGPPDRDPGPA